MDHVDGLPMALYSPGAWLEVIALIASILSSLWLVKVCSPCSKLLSSRQFLGQNHGNPLEICENIEKKQWKSIENH